MATAKPTTPTNATPKQVQIGPIVYTVVEVEELHEEGAGRFLYGDIHYGKCRIRVDADLDPQAKHLTLWHEILHGILNGAGIDSADHDEQHIDALAHGIVQVLRDNPGLLCLV